MAGEDDSDPYSTGDEEEASSIEKKSSGKTRKKSWRDSRIEQIHPPAESLKREKLFPTTENMFKNIMEKGSLGLGGQKGLFKSREKDAKASISSVTTHLTDSMHEKKIREKSSLYSGTKAKRRRLRPRPR